MTKYKAIIIEDNPDNADVLRRIIADDNPEIQVVAEANTIKNLFAKLKALDENNNQIIISTANNNKEGVAVANITYFEADGQTTIVHFQADKPLTAFRMLAHFKKTLEGEHSFFLVHNSLYVNVAQVKSFRYKDLEITFKNGKIIQASRRFGKDFKKYWEDFNDGKGRLLKDFLNLSE